MKLDKRDAVVSQGQLTLSARSTKSQIEWVAALRPISRCPSLTKLNHDCELIFTTPRGRMWRERNFYRDVWKPTQEACRLDIRPHECRHSYVTHLRAAGINDADLAAIAGHRVETMLARYTHAAGTSFEAVRVAIG